MLSRIFAFLAVVMVAGGALAETLYYVAPDSDEGITVRDSSEKTLPLGAPDLSVTENNVTFRIFFNDIRDNTNIGFDSPTVGANARARMQEALTYIADVINENGTVDIVVTDSQTDGSGALAFAGTFFTVTPGFQQGFTLQRLSTGVKPFSNNEEISCTVDFGFNWNFSTSAPAGNQADFRSVITHEFTHGLGFASLSDSTGASQIGPGTYATFDSLMNRGTPNKVLFSGSPPSFKGTTADLISNNLIFFGTQANVLYAQGTRPGLFAPNPFLAGSSLSHWDTGNIVGGAVMEHAITLGTMRHEYAPVDIGALVDLGYTNAAAPGASPGNLTVSPNLGGGVSVGAASVGSFISTNFTVHNDGGTAIAGTATANAPFSIVSGANFNVAPGADATVQVRFTPTVVGLATGNLNVTGDPDGTIIVPLLGTGTSVAAGNLVVTPNPANFGTVTVGSTSSKSFTIQNTGGTAITGTAASSGAPFSITSGANFTVNPGNSATVQVLFTPTGAGAFSKNLNVTGDPDGTISVPMNGTGSVLPGNLTTSPDITAGIDFGSVASDAFSEFSFTLANNGGASITGQATTSGAPFEVTVGASFTLAAGESTTVKVKFTPTDTVDFTGALTLTGDPDGAIVGNLIGTGLKASTASCSAVKGQSSRWSFADGVVVALCGLGLVLGSRRVVRVRA